MFAQGPPSPPSFEVASVRLNKSGGWGGRLPQILPGGQFVSTNIPIREIVRRAYGLNRHQTIEGPGLLDSQIDIVAKVPEAYASPAASSEFLPAMLRTLLAERFKLAAHVETREMSVYILEVARSDGSLGPRITPEMTDCVAARVAAADERASNAQALVATIQAELAGTALEVPYKPLPRLCSQGVIGGDWSAHSITIAQFVDLLTTLVQQPVLDRTGLTDTYSFTLEFTASDAFIFRRPPGSEPAAPDGRPLFRDALEQQLGLKLTSGRGPVERLIIDHVELPTLD